MFVAGFTALPVAVLPLSRQYCGARRHDNCTAADLR